MINFKQDECKNIDQPNVNLKAVKDERSIISICDVEAIEIKPNIPPEDLERLKDTK